MPTLRGGLAQYTYAALGALPAIIAILGGYIVTNCFTSSTEVAMCGIVFEEFWGWGVPPYVVGIIIIVILCVINLMGIDIFAKVQNVVAWALLGSMLVLALVGILGKGMGMVVEQPFMVTEGIRSVLALAPMAFWLFIGAEFIIPMAGDIKNPKRNVPLGMFLSLLIILVLLTLTVFGFHNYVPWADLGAADSPHIVYGVLLLGDAGIIWMGIVAILAAISTVNVVIGSCARILEGMGKMGLIPAIFKKRNTRNAPYAGILLMSGGLITVLAVAKAADAEGLIVLILTGCTFWMVAYVIGHINNMVMRHRMPDAPRSFKLPLGPVLPVVGIVGMIWMILTIDPDPDFRMTIWRTVLIALVLLAIYGIIWIKLKVKRPFFKPMPVEEILAMEEASEAEQRAEWEAKAAKKASQ
jgi:amino acid transporter